MMYDRQDGVMRELDPGLTKGVREDERSFKQRLRDAMRRPEYITQAGERAGIPAVRQGPVFEIDEEIYLKGVRFIVRGFEGGLLHLQGSPR